MIRHVPYYGKSAISLQALFEKFQKFTAFSTWLNLDSRQVFEEFCCEKVLKTGIVFAVDVPVDALFGGS